MLLQSEYQLLILAERRAAERIAALLRLRDQQEADGLTRYGTVDFELTLARKRMEAVSRLLDHNAGATTEDVREALAYA